MEKKIKKLMKISAIFFLLVISSCEKDLYEEGIQQSTIQQRQGKVNRVSIKDVPFLMPSIKKFKNSVTGRGVIDSLKLDLNNIVEYAESETSKSYSIPVIKDVPDEKFNFENVHILKVGAEEYVAFIAKYIPLTEDPKFDALTFSGKIEIYDENKQYMGSITYENGLLKLTDQAPPTGNGDGEGHSGGSDGGILGGSNSGDSGSHSGGIIGWIQEHIFGQWNGNPTRSNGSSGSSGSSYTGNGTGFFIIINLGGQQMGNSDNPNTQSGTTNGNGGVVVAPNEPQLAATNNVHIMRVKLIEILGYEDSYYDEESNYIQTADADEIASLYNYLREDIVTKKILIQRWFAIQRLVKINPTLLLNIPCAEIPKWQQLVQFHVPASVKTKITTLDSQSIFTDYHIQYLDNAGGAAINLDYFPVTINTLPLNAVTGVPFTPSEFLTYIRLHMNNFVNTTLCSFNPTTLNTGFNESQIWNSTNPLGAILHLDIPQPAGDGSVVCSESTPVHWILTTVEVPYGIYQGQDGMHPVSGHREFGLIYNSNGTYTFYTRGVDRISSGFEATVAENGTAIADPFANPDALWNSLKTNVYNYVQNHSGNAQPISNNDNVIWRPDWNKVRQVLHGEVPMSTLGCH